MTTEKISPSSTEVIICDDHLAIRAGLHKIFSDSKINVVGQCDSLSSLLLLTKDHPIAVIVSDLGIDGIPIRDYLEKIRNVSTNCKMVIYSMRDAPGTITICYETGVLGYVSKNESIDELINAVKAAYTGQRYITPSVSMMLANYMIDQNVPTNVLSEKELEVFLSYVSKESTDDLAKRLGLSERYIHNVLSKIAKKLGINRSEFLEFAQKYGLIE